MNSDKPNPGSDAAIEQGCTCPMEQGQAYAGRYWISGNCPLHGNHSGPVALAGEGDRE